jgi:hypothetical protein
MKEKKSAGELQTMIMQEVRKHPDWSHVLDVAITQSVQTAPHHANWSVGFTCDGPRMAPGEAFQFARELSNKFDLA